MKTRNQKRAALAKAISKTLNVSINMAYKYIRGYSALTWKQAVELKNKGVISFEDLENIEDYLCKELTKKGK